MKPYFHLLGAAELPTEDRNKMRGYGDSLRGYSYDIHSRDGFVCVYCGLDGKVWPNWLYLSRDHLLPKGHPNRDDPEYIVTACVFCNELHNRTVFDVEGKDRSALIEQKRPLVLERRAAYKKFWEQHVRESSNLGDNVVRQQRNAACNHRGNHS